MSAARTDWKSLPLEEKPLKERKPKPPSDEGFAGVVKESKRKPPSDEGGAPRSESEISMIAGGNHTIIQ